MSHNTAPITPGLTIDRGGEGDYILRLDRPSLQATVRGLRSQAEAEAVAKAILEATTGGRGSLPRLVADRSIATMASRL